jgi:deoxyribonuclease V
MTDRLAARFFPETLDGAAALQRRLADRVEAADRFGPLRVVGGADLSYDRQSHTLFAAVVTFDAGTREVLEVGRFSGPALVPYVPGFLSFREGPAVVRAIAALSRPPDLLFCDGHGRAHPRRCGLACHLGVALDLPAIGVGKSLLVGEHGALGARRGSTAALVHGGDTVGVALRTRSRVRPVFVSTGHRVALATAVALVLEWAPRFRLPEPARRAHREVNLMRRAAVARALAGEATAPPQDG